MNDMFKSPRLKVERAYKHIGDLEGLISDFAGHDAHKIVVKHNAALGIDQILFESSERLPTLINLIFGDAVHNLRAALDYAWAQAMLAFDPTIRIGDVSFPLAYEKKEGLIGTLKDEKARHAVAMATPGGLGLLTVMVDSIQPYGTWDNPLRMLNKLDNIDKHRLLLTVIIAGGMYIKDLYDPKTNVRFSNLKIINKTPKGGPLIGYFPGTELQGEAKPTIDVLIDETELSKFQSLIPTLKNIAKVVTQAIDAIESCVVTHTSDHAR